MRIVFKSWITLTTEYKSLIEFSLPKTAWKPKLTSTQYLPKCINSTISSKSEARIWRKPFIHSDNQKRPVVSITCTHPLPPISQLPLYFLHTKTTSTISSRLVSVHFQAIFAPITISSSTAPTSSGCSRRPGQPKSSHHPKQIRVYRFHHPPLPRPVVSNNHFWLAGSTTFLYYFHH